MNKPYSVIIPAYDEAEGVGKTVQELLELGKKSGFDFDIIVVDDGSIDQTAEVASRYPVTVLKNLQNVGYGYSIKKGILAAKNEGLIVIDADGTYPITAIPDLVDDFEKGFDMVVGARHGKHYRGSLIKYPARLIFTWLAEFATGQHIPDINSGLRIFRKSTVMKYFHTLCAGFSFTTTITLAFLLNFNSVKYHPIDYFSRIGKSKVRYFRDTLRTTQIIVESILYYNPIKAFLLLAMAAVAIGVLAILALFILPGVLVTLLFFSCLIGLLVFSVGLVASYMHFMNMGDNSKR